MKLRCIAVDDEPLALEMVSDFIRQTSFLSLEGKFDNAIEALSHINQNEIELIFLDIQMPDLSGMELARVLEGNKTGKKPKIIFTTAYNQFAIEGYKVDALDYLLKPFSYEEFLKASSKAYNFFASATKEPLKENVGYIFLKVEYQLVKIMLKDIILIEGYKDYVKIHLESRPAALLSLNSLKNLEDLLPANQFMRIHRSFIISLDHIQSITRNSVNMGKITITVSDNYKENFSAFLNKWIN
jgi:DNA-binding LytR/AlgR family response regulator